MTVVQRKASEQETGHPYPDYQDISVLLSADFTLESGEKLTRPEVRVRIYGDLSLPLIVSLGGISSGRQIADTAEGAGWWRNIVGAGAAVDLERYCVLTFDFLPNAGDLACTVTTADQARALACVFHRLNIETAYGFVGASYGGMVALTFAARYPQKVEKLCVVSAADRPHPAATAVRGIQRRIIKLAAACGKPQEGVALARELAMTTYRTPEEFGERFESAPGTRAGDPYDVCRYLIARGRAFDITPARFLALSDSIDRHRMSAAEVTAETVLISVSSDRLVPPEDMRRLAAEISGPHKLHEIQSTYGHDAFLKETDVIGAIVNNFFQGTPS